MFVKVSESTLLVAVVAVPSPAPISDPEPLKSHSSMVGGPISGFDWNWLTVTITELIVSPGLTPVNVAKLDSSSAVEYSWTRDGPGGAPPIHLNASGRDRPGGMRPGRRGNQTGTGTVYRPRLVSRALRAPTG